MGVVIKPKDYETIFRVIQAVSRAVDNTDGKACLLYNMIGSIMLTHCFKVNARAVMGGALILVDEVANGVLCFADSSQPPIDSNENAFHCWIECDGVWLDFTAPLYRESYRNAGSNLPIKRKMMQKPLSLMSSSPFDMRKEGDFYLSHNQELTQSLKAKFYSTKAGMDLADVCLYWFKKSPAKTPKSLTMGVSDGKPIKMELNNMGIAGCW